MRFFLEWDEIVTDVKDLSRQISLEISVSFSDSSVVGKNR